MGFDLGELREAVERHGRVVRVVIADVRGSSPREVGAAMLVWKTGQSRSEERRVGKECRSRWSPYH